LDNVGRILVTMQATMDCQAVFGYAARLAERLQARLFVLDVVYNPFAYTGWNLPMPSMEKDYQRLVDEVRDRLRMLVGDERERGFPAEYIVREGDPAIQVMKVVEEEKIDLLIMPFHEETRLEHFLWGKMAEKIIRKMPCSVLLVRHDPENLCSMDE